MKKLTIFIMSTIISSFALADFEIPNQFEDGQVTSASQMNENFQALKAEIRGTRSKHYFTGTVYPYPITRNQFGEYSGLLRTNRR